MYGLLAGLFSVILFTVLILWQFDYCVLSTPLLTIPWEFRLILQIISRGVVGPQIPSI